MVKEATKRLCEDRDDVENSQTKPNPDRNPRMNRDKVVDDVRDPTRGDPI
jgi:hypothetical protein